MTDIRRLATACGAAGVALTALAAAAVADGYEQASAPPLPAADARKFSYSFNIRRRASKR
jgi:hypothetical protein